MPDIAFDRFLRYPELTDVLQALAAEHPDLCAVTSIGSSYEGRDIWLATLTNTATGPAEEKPALWVDANIHATELTGSVAALYLLHRLLTGYGTDEQVTRALDTRCFYVVPRVNPDGAELALADRPKYIRSSTRPWPRADEQPGLVPEDLDGDGRILQMRVEDPNGTWTPCADDPRLLMARDPAGGGDGPFYRLLTEGTIREWDGVTIKAAPPLEGLDLNRNFPIEWRTENEQKGAGPYPTSEAEVRAVVQAVIDRPNICAYIAYHTQSGVHLRPYGTQPDEKLPTNDLRVFTQIGKKATELTGYPAVSVYHDFRYDPRDNITGVADDWAYEHIGVHSWTTEFWSPLRAAGITDFKFIEWYLDHPVEDDLALLRWNDEALDGKGFVGWYPFEHPQLGAVELGGWDGAYCWRNPPPHLLEPEVAPHTDWALWHVLISPRLELVTATATPLGDGAWQVRLVVQNTGWLPTNVTEKAVERKVVRPVEAEIAVPASDGAPGGGDIEVIGERRRELGQLAGRALKTSSLGFGGGAGDGTADRAKADWVVRAPAGTAVRVEARHQRAGVVRAEVVLEPS